MPFWSPFRAINIVWIKATPNLSENKKCCLHFSVHGSFRRTRLWPGGDVRSLGCGVPVAWLRVCVKRRSCLLVGGFKYCLFSPLPRKMIQFDVIFFKWVETTNSFLVLTWKNAEACKGYIMCHHLSYRNFLVLYFWVSKVPGTMNFNTWKVPNCFGVGFKKRMWFSDVPTDLLRRFTQIDQYICSARWLNRLILKHFHA